MALKFITPVVVLHVDVQAHFKLLSVFLSGQTVITSTTFHCAAQSHSVPVCPGLSWVAPFPTVHCQTRGKPRLLSSLSFCLFLSFFFTLPISESLSFSYVHLSSLLLHHVSCYRYYVKILNYCLLSLCYRLYSCLLFCDICLYRYVVTEKKDSFLLWGY